MSIKADIYSTKKSTTSIEEKYPYTGWGLLGLLIILIQLEFIGENWFSGIMIIALLVLIVIQTSTYFSTGKYQKELLGIIEFNENYIVWEEKKIEWQQLKQVNIQYKNYAGGINYQIIDEYDSSIATGYENKICITTEKGEKIKGEIFIQSKMMSENLHNLFWKVVKENKVSLKDAKHLIHPKNYKEHQELKKYYD